MEYKIITANTLDELQKKVEGFLKKGYSLQGSITANPISDGSMGDDVAYFREVYKK